MILPPRLTRRGILLGTSILAVTLQTVLASAIPGTDSHSRSATALTLLHRRGGDVAAAAAVDDIADDNAELDAYIDALVAGVDDSEHDTPEVTHEVSPAVAGPDNDDDDDDDDFTNVTDDEERLRRTAPESQTHEEQQNQQIIPRRRYPRPNAVYRFLLDQGRVGRILVMLLIWIAEFVRAFIPPLANAVSAILTAIFGSGPESLEDERGINNQYVAFVDSRRTLRGKDKKKAVRMADQEAAEQLRRVGSVTEARYKHLSQDFMQRHGLGPYARDMEDEQPSETAMDDGERAEYDAPLVDEDEDVDWIVAALTDDDPKPVTRTGVRPSKPAIDVGVSSTGVTVGVSFSIGGGSAGANNKKKKSKRRKKLIEAATSNVAEKRVKAGPRASDRDGGGGVLGRIRDFSANNLVSRSLLGAYPGDALPPMEAASATGLCDFAMKYGFGDWSDEEDEYSAPSGKRQRQKKRKTTTTSNSSKRRRKPKSGSASSSSSSLSLDFDFTPSFPKTSSRVEKLPRRDSSQSDLESRRSDKMVRLPTERLREKDAMLLSKVEAELSQIGEESRRSRKLVRPPTELLREKDAALHKEPKG